MPVHLTPDDRSSIVKGPSTWLRYLTMTAVLAGVAIASPAVADASPAAPRSVPASPAAILKVESIAFSAGLESTAQGETKSQF